MSGMFLSLNSLLLIGCGFILGAGAGIGVARIKKNAKAKKMPDEQMQTTFVFSGNLKQTSLVDAVQFLEIGKREGILHVYSGRRKGYVTFQSGSVIDAVFRNATGKEAFFLLMSLEEGDFYFEPKSVEQPRLITDTIMDLVFEWDAAHGQQ